ncbi:MBL fold metallo-hydrolase [Actinomadura verrucosospora]|uniref:Metallo-beta-lactamase domain-containing protein n=1 Tax=Actinomadura verrucosospora TaxID=46165 RepID=A0A7D3ZHY0_ACTVE|nr:hypothetical protein [Actinomadura verrucosospora]QKG18582.1 hypothetical protein ACTIVE_0216 [Actinomadura verrucosospora]
MLRVPEQRPEHPELLEQGHPFRQWKTWRIPGAELTLTGYSRANDKTFFHIPELRCSLDAGLCEGRQVDTVFLTHHGPGFAPALAEGHRMHGVRQGDEFVFGRRGHHVRVVECEHKVPCVGYAFSERRKALLPEFEELRRSLVEQGRGGEFGRIMARRRKDGVEVDGAVDRPLFAFLGDTHVNVFERNPWLFDYPVVITECTFLDDAESDRANRIGHTVWSRLGPVIEAHPRTLFVLTHFSLRYSDREVLAFFRREWEARGGRPDNVLLWVHPESRLPEQHRHS